MTCGYCQFVNTEEDHRCRKCGRRLAGTAIPVPAHLAKEHVRIAVRALGANALAARVEAEPSTAEPRPARRAPEISLDAAATLDSLPRSRVASPAQPSLFGAELQPKIIPFETLSRTSAPAPSITIAETPVVTKIAPITPSKPASKATHPRRSAPASDAQATLDFLPLKNAPRTLKTNAEAVIFCGAEAAAPIHRATAAALDMSMIMIAFGSILLIFQTVAKPAHLDRNSLILLGAILGVTALLYGALFAIAGTVTPGMKWTNLRLINFDGFPLEGRTRALRFAASWISVLSGGIGLLWALLDEENLTWHDHVSKTFPTLRESESIVVRARKR